MALNGRLSGSELGTIPGTNRQLLRELVPQTAAMRDAFQKHFGKSLVITDAYRDYETQVRLKREKGPYAASPGTSNHGWGRALDLGSGVNTSFTSPEHIWMRKMGPRFGWIHPTWAHDHNNSNGMDEPWHFEASGVVPVSSYQQVLNDVGIPTPTAPTPTAPKPIIATEEDDMILIQTPTAFWTLQGGVLAGVATMELVNELTAKGVTRVFYSADEFNRLRSSLAGRELIRNPQAGFAVGRPGDRYVGLADIAEVQFHQMAGVPEREVSLATFQNLTGGTTVTVNTTSTVNAEEIAAAIAREIAKLPVGSSALTDEEISRIAKTTVDEQSRRLTD